MKGGAGDAPKLASRRSRTELQVCTSSAPAATRPGAEVFNDLLLPQSPAGGPRPSRRCALTEPRDPCRAARRCASI